MLNASLRPDIDLATLPQPDNDTAGPRNPAGAPKDLSTDYFRSRKAGPKGRSLLDVRRRRARRRAR